jgi:hypothetical protein
LSSWETAVTSCAEVNGFSIIIMLFGTPLDGQSAAYVNDRHVWLDLASDTRVFPAMGQFAKAYVRYHATDCGVWRVKYFNRLPAARYCPDKKSSIQEQHGFIIGEEYRNRFQCFPRSAESNSTRTGILRFPALLGYTSSESCR